LVRLRTQKHEGRVSVETTKWSKNPIHGSHSFAVCDKRHSLFGNRQAIVFQGGYRQNDSIYLLRLNGDDGGDAPLTVERKVVLVDKQTNLPFTDQTLKSQLRARGPFVCFLSQSLQLYCVDMRKLDLKLHPLPDLQLLCAHQALRTKSLQELSKLVSHTVFELLQGVYEMMKMYNEV